MTRLDFDEAAAMARKIVEACTDVKMYHYVKTFVLDAFDKTIRSAESANQSADTETHNFDDGFYLMRDAIRVAEAWLDLWSDMHHNGRPSRWLKITDDLALHGKAESLLVLKDRSDLYRKDPKSPHEEVWELHQRNRTHLRKPGEEDLVYQQIKEQYLPLLCNERRQWRITQFSLQVRSGRRVENLPCGPQRLDNSFYAFVFPGLEVLGFQTPVLYL